jgi:hypothetical protein
VIKALISRRSSVIGAILAVPAAILQVLQKLLVRLSGRCGVRGARSRLPRLAAIATWRRSGHRATSLRTLNDPCS